MHSPLLHDLKAWNQFIHIGRGVKVGTVHVLLRFVSHCISSIVKRLCFNRL